MAPVASTVALSHFEGVTDSQRERELYKYYQPSAPINTDTSGAGPASEDMEPTQRPNVTSNIASSKISSPDTALTAFCQLVTWRTGSERAMIRHALDEPHSIVDVLIQHSLIDSSTQYFIAESTKTVDLVDNTSHAPGDEIWIGCDNVSKAGRLCERTIEVAPTGDSYPCFIVNDLTKDERFNELPFVTGSPFLKYYAGVPLITKRGIPIGSLFVVDSRVRPDLSPLDINFMGTMAVTIMRHLEMVRAVEEHRRGMKMSRGLASFVEGRADLVEAETVAEPTEGTKVAGHFEADSGIAQTKSKSGSMHGSIPSTHTANTVERREKEYSNALAKTEEVLLASHAHSESQTSRPTLEENSQPNSFAETSVGQSSPIHGVSEDTHGEDISEESSIKFLFSRAANLIREAFEVDGGAVFYDAQRGFGDLQVQQKQGLTTNTSHEDTHTSSDDLPSSSEQQDNPGENISIQEESLGSSKDSNSPSLADSLGKGMFTRSTRSSTELEKKVEILGFSTVDASSINGDEYPGPQSFVPFDEKSLHKLLRRYPRGKLWTFDSDGAVSSSSEEEFIKPQHKDPAQNSKDLHKRKMRSVRAKSDARFLSIHFPGVRQLLFVPLWDNSRTRWLSGCCVWSTEPTRILSKQNELSFLTAFGNSVMAECSRMDTQIADQKKGDFIGSISHELRSPLHGILASAEFLGEEVSTGFEKGLVETIDSCGRTLLDTINHILDFSKINHFEKNWRKNQRGVRPVPRSSYSVQGVRPSDLPMINLFADVDVSVVCEEVLEGVFAGHVFQNVTAPTFDMVPDARGKMSNNTMTGPEKLPNTEVAVILDVNMQNYHFTTQPGAFRRVVMNLLGNALKYTSHGYVRVSLEAAEMEDLHIPATAERIPRSMVTVTVTDTGRGISSEFLRTKLFTPFAQENSLSSGTGLGLSIVKSIVQLLEGELTIDSELGRGTQVRVTIPLLRDMPKTAESTSSTPKSATSIARETDESVSLLRARVVGQKVSLHGFDIDSKDPIIQQTSKLLQASVTNFLTNWYGLKVVPLGQRAAIVVLNEASPATVSRVLQQCTINNKAPAILVLCSHSSRFQRSSSQSGPAANVSFVAKPLGPFKLARALTQCLEGAPSAITPGLLEAPPTESNDLSSFFEELSLSPHGGELLDNSRMAADSDNARKAIESPTPNASIAKHQEFPFPVEDGPPVSKTQSMPGDKESLKPLMGSDILRKASTVLSQIENTSSSSSSMTRTTTVTPALSTPPSLPKMRSPRLLLVDDNKINLGLLRAFMKKRKYEVVDGAENGLQAVQQFEQREDGFDIIFMDISMPVLNGFEATKQIRAIEAMRRKKATNDAEQGKESVAAKPGALIIALTGLASSRDQSEAASVGIDVFLTKPVAFKEVGKMMDNWQANQERDERGSGDNA